MVLCTMLQKHISVTNLNSHKLYFSVNCSDKQFSHSNGLNSTDTSLVLNPPENLTKLFNQLNYFSSDQNQNSDSISIII